MTMNMFTVQILQMLLDTGEVSVQTLLQRLELTRRMFLYYQKQLNDFLHSSGLGKTEIREEILYLEEVSVEEIRELLEHFDLKYYYPEARERQESMLLQIGLSEKPQFLEGFEEEFHVSKRTLSNDLILLKEHAGQYGVTLSNQAKKGYRLEGDEWTIRYLLLSAYHNRKNIVTDRIKKEILLKAYGERCPQKEEKNLFEEIRQILIGSEAYSKEKFVYFSLPDLVQTILLVYLRGKKCPICPAKEEEGQPSFRGIDYVERELAKLSICFDAGEKNYLGLVLQSAKISNHESGGYEEMIMKLTEDIIGEFKHVSGLEILKTSELFAMFLIHIRSMYYRTRYRIKITNFYERLEGENRAFFYITRQVMQKISRMYDLLVDDDEIQFMSYYFQCMVGREETLPKKKDKIVLICVSGLGTSVYLRHQILRLFEHSFSVEISDLRNLEKVLDENTHLIISTVDIGAEFCKGIRIIQVSMILTPQNKKELIDWLLHEEVYLQNYEIVSDMLNIVKNYAVIQDQEKLFRKLTNYFGVEQKTEEGPGLGEMLSVEDVRIYESAQDWKEGIQKAAEPLLDSGVICEDYVRDMLEVIEKHGPYCEFLSGMLLAHAEPHDHVRRPAISLAVFRKPIPVEEWKKEITAIFVLGVVDQSSHAAALSELVTNLSEGERYKSLNSLESREEIYRILRT